MQCACAVVVANWGLRLCWLIVDDVSMGSERGRGGGRIGGDREIEIERYIYIERVSEKDSRETKQFKSTMYEDGESVMRIHSCWFRRWPDKERRNTIKQSLRKQKWIPTTNSQLWNEISRDGIISFLPCPSPPLQQQPADRCRRGCRIHTRGPCQVAANSTDEPHDPYPG